MVLFNYSTKELTAKIVYYGPGLCGKTTNLQYIHSTLPDTVKGKMLSLATKTDRTLFFDFLPIDLGDIRGMKTRVQLYTVPGQVFYNETRKLVLKGADGIVFVADSQKQMVGANVESFKNLEENLKGHGMKLAEMPHVIQFNKRDLPKLATMEELNSSMNKYNAPFYESVATTGIGVQDSLKAITKLVLLHLTKKYDGRSKSSRAAAPAPAQPPVVETPAPAPMPEVSTQAPAAEGMRIPLSDMAAAAAPPSAPPVQASVAPDPLPEIADQDISDLMNEVEATGGIDTPAPMAAHPAPEAPSIEIDHGVDPDWSADPEPARADAAAPAAVAAQIPDPAMDESVPVILTDPLRDTDLFSDPGLEVARLGHGGERDIVVPVEVGDAQTGVRRFKLSIRLRLDPVD